MAFFKTFVSVVIAILLSVPIMAIPLQPVRRHAQSSYLPISFDNYMGLSSMSNFDNFYGVNNFGGSSNEIVIQQTKETESVVCSQQDVVIIQQQLAVLVEYAKMILTTSICEVEVQTIVYSQFLSSVQSFSGDLLRQSGRPVGYDHSVASKIGQLHDSEGNLQNNNLGFTGVSVGSNFVSPSGNTWNNQTSPASAGSAYGLACAAGGSS